MITEMGFNPWVTVLVSLIYSLSLALDITVQQFKESPGLYYDHVGQVKLYSTEWKFVTYIDLLIADGNFETVRNYAQMSAEFCKRHEHLFWTNYRSCSNSIRQRQIKEVNGLKLLLRQLTHDDSVHRRNKRGVFNLVGSISKILFGTMDDQDAMYYADKISLLER